MGHAQEDDEEHHLEEGDVDVAGRKGEADDAKDGGDGALDDGQTQGVEAGGDTLLRAAALLRHVVVADVGREVHGEPDAHDEVDQGDAVEVDAPPGHVAKDAGLNAEDGEGDPEAAHRVGDHDEADDHHEGRGDEHGLDGLGHDLEVLVHVDKVGMEHRYLKNKENNDIEEKRKGEKERKIQ